MSETLPSCLEGNPDEAEEYRRGYAEHGEPYAHYVGHTEDPSIDNYEEAYDGIYDSAEDFAENFVDRFCEIEDWLEPYIDYKGLGEELLSCDYWSAEVGYEIVVFRRL